ncbi:MAG TPA: hypothetical protein VFI03_05415 [Solirubrobacterales bacterium]|nr:hypothetical protein [Solirubrobacterales bacterium]
MAASGDQCPNCSAHMAPDQRYCLNCGNRRGDPRLPFMDAVVFMDAVKRPRGAAAPPPQPPSQRRKGISPNASLIAGVATLVLAIGVGVLIGRSGEQGATTANTTPQVIKVEGGGGGGTETAAASGGKEANAGGSGKSKKAAKSETEAGSSGTSKAAEEVLKPEAGVKLPPPKAQVGEDCEQGTAGCSSGGEFDGSFFGE